MSETTVEYNLSAAAQNGNARRVWDLEDQLNRQGIAVGKMDDCVRRVSLPSSRAESVHRQLEVWGANPRFV
jgi:hypothetical protein